MPGKDTITSDHVKGLEQIYGMLEKGKTAFEKEGVGTEELAAFGRSLSAVGGMQKLKEKIDFLKKNVGKLELAGKDYVNTKANLNKLKDEAQKGYNKVLAFKKKPWTVTVHSAVTAWCSSHQDQALGRTVAEIKKVGMDAGGLRAIAGNCYDVHVSSAGDYRIVGLADAEQKTFAFHAIYRHGPSGGKEFVAGNRVNTYG